MSTEMDWSPDYCLSCDNQITEGAYCSQACRLADLEKAGHSESVSPLSTSASSTASYASQATTSHSHSGFYLPPAVNFSSYNRPAQRTQSYPQQTVSSTASSAATYNYSSPPSPTYFTYAASNSESQSQNARLSASSSRSSLSSVPGYDKSQGLTPQAASALRGYVSSFDQVRETKRRYRS